MDAAYSLCGFLVGGLVGFTGIGGGSVMTPLLILVRAAGSPDPHVAGADRTSRG
jgi:hypothetical protein